MGLFMREVALFALLSHIRELLTEDRKLMLSELPGLVRQLKSQLQASQQECEELRKQLADAEQENCARQYPHPIDLLARHKLKSAADKS